MSRSDKEYSNGEITVFWNPDLCIHSAHCVASLPKVFHPQERPWITLEHAGTDEIIKTVSGCPSGALSFKKNSE